MHIVIFVTLNYTSPTVRSYSVSSVLLQGTPKGYHSVPRGVWHTKYRPLPWTTARGDLEGCTQDNSSKFPVQDHTARQIWSGTVKIIPTSQLSGEHPTYMPATTWCIVLGPDGCGGRLGQDRYHLRLVKQPILVTGILVLKPSSVPVGVTVIL